MSIEPGTVVAERYRVYKPLGKGGMGEVFSAENTRTGRMVALKVLRSESKQKKSSVERFRREARAAGVIKSDYVTQVLDVEDDPEHGIVLVFELLEGESLVDRLKRTGPMTMQELWPVVEAVWLGLSDAHAAGIVHRDLKPSNVFLLQPLSLSSGVGSRVKILDFGISKLPKEISTDSLTQVGQSLGTFSFMPPEQIGRAKTVDHRADVYACTTLIFQALSGKLPYNAKNVVAMMELKTKQDPRTLADAMGRPVDARIEAYIAKGLARNPDMRFQTALEALIGWREFRQGASPGAEAKHDPWRPEEDAKTVMIRRQLQYGGPVPQDVTTSSGNGVIPSAAYRTDQPAEDSSTVPPTVPRQRISGPADGVMSPAPPSNPGTGGGAPPAMTPPAMRAPMRSSPGPTGTVPMPDAPSFVGPPAAAFVITAPARAAGLAPARGGGMRTVVALLLGAIGLMLVGFFAVALALRYLR